MTIQSCFKWRRKRCFIFVFWLLWISILFYRWHSSHEGINLDVSEHQVKAFRLPGETENFPEHHQNKNNSPSFERQLDGLDIMEENQKERKKINELPKEDHHNSKGSILSKNEKFISEHQSKDYEDMSNIQQRQTTKNSLDTTVDCQAAIDFTHMTSFDDRPIQVC